MHAIWIAIALLIAAEQAGAAPFAYVPGALSSDVTVIDVATNTVVTTIPVGTLPIGVAIHPANTRVYVANRDDGTVTEIDPSTNAVVATFAVGNSLQALAVHPGGTRMYAAHFASQIYASCTSSCVGYISEIDLVSRMTIDTFPVGLNISQLVMHPDGVRLYASDNTNNVLSVIDTTTNTTMHTVPTGGTQAQSIVFNNFGTVGYVSNTAGNSVGVINAVIDTFVTTIPVGNNPASLALTPDGTRLYVPNSGLSYGGGGTISVIDTATNVVITTLTGGPHNSGISMTPDGRAYVTNVATGDPTDSVSVLDTTTNTILTTVPVGIRPYAYGKFITGPLPACTNDAQCVAPAGPCRTATCSIGTGACAFVNLGDGTLCDAGVPDTCSIADACDAGQCVAGGGGDADGDGVCDADDTCPSIPDADQADLDNDGTGNLCDLSDAALTVTKIRLKRTSATRVNGSATLRGEFVVTSAEDAVTTTAGMTLRFQDALATTLQQAWSPAQCISTASGRITCRTLDRAAGLKIAPSRSVPDGYRVDARLRHRDLQPPFAGPVLVTLTYGESIDRGGSIASCASTDAGLTCRP